MSKTEHSDRELLELAAKAAVIELRWHEPEWAEDWCYIPSAKPPHNRRESDAMAGVIWNPLDEDGDALRLAVKLGLDVKVDGFKAQSREPLGEDWFVEQHDGAEGAYAATRRAIVRAAANLATGA